MARKKSQPAELIEKRFGGSREASRLLGYHSEITVACWKSRGGEIPRTKDVRRVLETAKRLGIPFTAEEALYGGFE